MIYVGKAHLRITRERILAEQTTDELTLDECPDHAPVAYGAVLDPVGPRRNLDSLDRKSNKSTAEVTWAPKGVGDECQGFLFARTGQMAVSVTLLMTIIWPGYNLWEVAIERWFQ